MARIAQYELHDVGYVEEAVYGNTPSSPSWTELWHNAFGVVPKRATLQSRRKLGNRQRPLPRLGKKRVEGSIDAELCYGAFEDWLEALLNGRFPTPFTEISGTTIAAVAATQTFTDSGSGFGDIEVGDWISVSGFTNSANNGIFHVTAAAAGSITVDQGTTLVDELAGNTITINQRQRLIAGSDELEPFAEISGTTLAAVAASQTITDSASGLGNIAVGDWISVSGFTNAANNGIFRVTAAASGSITVADGSTLVDESAGNTVTINQKTERSFSLIGRYKDIGVYHVFTGVMPKSASLNVVPDDIAKVQFTILGADFDKSGTNPASLTSPGSYEPFDALSGTFTEDGSSVCMTGISLNIENNNILADKCLGTTAATAQLQGGFDVTGQVSFYFKDNSHVTKFWAETEVAIEFTLTDPDGNQYTVGLPYVRLSEMELSKGEGDIEAEERFNLTAGEDPTMGCTLYVDRIPA